MGEPKVLAKGVDTLHVSGKGAVRADVWDQVDELRKLGELNESAELAEFPETGQAFFVQPRGLRWYSLWLSSDDYELLMSKSDRRPAVQVQLHSAYLHSMGVHDAMRLVGETLRKSVMTDTRVELGVSRIDLYADVQGWPLELGDLERFVSWSRVRRGFLPADLDGEVDETDSRQVYALGRRLTGFVFGVGSPLLARVYDKTTEIQRRGKTWLPDLWGERESDEPVWRVEFQMRRPVLVEHGLRTVEEVLAGVQDLWRYCAEDWLTYRRPTSDSRLRRWPIDPAWEVVQSVRLAPSVLGVVRRRNAEASEERVVQGLAGYVTSLAALRGWDELEAAMELSGPILRRYWESKGRTFLQEVGRKQARRMEVSGWLDGETDDEGAA
jgi:hypothetical protein